MPAAGITLKFGEGGHRISVDALAEALKNALEMLRGIGQDFTPGGAVVRWEVVKASLRSPLTLTIAPRAEEGRELPRAFGKRTADACVSGLAELEREPTHPAHFNEEALTAAEKMFRVVQRDGTTMAVASGRASQVAPTARAIANIGKVVEKARIYIDYGTIEGRLDEVSVHDGPHFTIWEALTDYSVNCVVTVERLEEAKTLLGQRVTVSGRVRYRNHIPKSIHVEEIRRLREAKELPQLKDMPPIDITGGLSSEDYVRRLRDAR